MPTISPPLVPSGGTRTPTIEEQLQRAGTLAPRGLPPPASILRIALHRGAWRT